MRRANHRARRRWCNATTRAPTPRLPSSGSWRDRPRSCQRPTPRPARWRARHSPEPGYSTQDRSTPARRGREADDVAPTRHRLGGWQAEAFPVAEAEKDGAAAQDLGCARLAAPRDGHQLPAVEDASRAQDVQELLALVGAAADGEADPLPPFLVVGKEHTPVDNRPGAEDRNPRKSMREHGLAVLGDGEEGDEIGHAGVGCSGARSGERDEVEGDVRALIEDDLFAEAGISPSPAA